MYTQLIYLNRRTIRRPTDIPRRSPQKPDLRAKHSLVLAALALARPKQVELPQIPASAFR